jgi:hypothetical protein
MRMRMGICYEHRTLVFILIHQESEVADAHIPIPNARSLLCKLQGATQRLWDKFHVHCHYNRILYFSVDGT